MEGSGEVREKDRQASRVCQETEFLPGEGRRKEAFEAAALDRAARSRSWGHQAAVEEGPEGQEELGELGEEME